VDIPMELSRIIITEFGERQVIYLKEKDGERSFPIVIGSMEALAIDRRLKGRAFERPLTHDLLANVIEAMGGQVEKIVITDLRDHTFFATLYLRRGEELMEIDSRPSDAIALGVAFETPIFVAEDVLDEVLRGPATAAEKIEVLRERMQLLTWKIAEVNDRLSDENFLAKADEKLIADYRRSLDEMQSEYEAIERIIEKYG